MKNVFELYTIQSGSKYYFEGYIIWSKNMYFEDYIYCCCLYILQYSNVDTR